MAKKIYINPGHSNKDSGAVGYAKERDLNVSVSKYMNEYLLEHYDCETRIYSNDSLAAVCKDANNWGADLFVSNHFNAGGGDGFETFVYSEKRVDLGKIFAKHVKAVGQNLRLYGAAPGVKIRPSLYVLKNTNMTAILNEGAFVDNREDIQDWDEEHELKKLGIAYAKAVAEYLKLEEKATVPECDAEKAATTEPTKYILSMRVMSRGCAGEDVRALQILLKGRGYNGDMHTPDGKFGPNTEGAVKLYQKAKNLTVNGIADEKTMRSLIEV